MTVLRYTRTNGILSLLLLFICFLVVEGVHAQDEPSHNNSNGPITIDADSSEFDYESDKFIFRGLKLNQGALGIHADAAETRKLDFDAGTWAFSGNVVIESGTAILYSDNAKFTVANHELTEAELRGTPARFEQLIRESGQVTSGEAQLIVYQLGTDTLQLSNEARFSDGTNEISSDLITYDLQEKHLTADSGDTGPVKILIEPPDKESETKEAP